MPIPFEVLIEEKICIESFVNKGLLGLTNDFEDGRWRIGKFLHFIWDNVKETALSKKERDSLIGKEASTLAKAAKNLRIDKEGGEIAEIFLYGVMRHHYNALSVVPKIYYKQNTNDYAKGADSVHIVLDQGGEFSIWFGEAKFYNSLANVRLSKIVKSVSDTLHSGKLRKENSIIVNLSDIDLIQEIPGGVKSKIREMLSDNASLDLLKPKLHVPIMLLYEYPDMHSWSSLGNEKKAVLVKHQKERANAYFEAQIKKCSNSVCLYSEIKFHLILFPVPSKKEIIDKFSIKAGGLRDE